MAFGVAVIMLPTATSPMWPLEMKVGVIEGGRSLNSSANAAGRLTNPTPNVASRPAVPKSVAVRSKISRTCAEVIVGWAEKRSAAAPLM